MTIHLTREQVEAREYEAYNPNHYDLRINPDGSGELVPLLWYDDASYAQYQGDCQLDYDGHGSY